MKWLKKLYVQVLIGIALGILVGALWPETGAALKPLGDAFIKLIKMIIAPVIFCTVAGGIAHMGDLKKFGRVGGKALLYFELVSSFALILGLVVGEVVRPGAGFGIDPATLDPNIAAGYLKQAKADTVAGHLLNLIPDTFLGAFTGGDLLQVLLIAILTGFACSRLGAFGGQVAGFFDSAAKLFFSIIHIVVRAAPVGAFGAMAFTIGKYGLGSLVQLGALVGTFYLTAALFVVVVLGLIARLVGFSIFRFLNYIREEIVIQLGASSSEAALPQLMEKLERLGASKTVVGLVVPAGYSFNLDGTNIYMTLATVFLAQATGTHLTLVQEATLLGVAMLTSKGAAGVAGSGFITLAATLAVVPTIPIQALALLVGVDRFMSECRGFANLVGNGVATLVVARWENELDMDHLRTELAKGPGQAERARDHEAMLEGVEP
ncbi:MAG TPA: dicarboxylate/amino acid:cation symporter [Caulobacteraceae bacterium]|nr:dicarboxylate/amino acid:cation symporter [Caulobacteraceae bacterium]